MIVLDCNCDLNSGEAVRYQEGEKELGFGNVLQVFVLLALIIASVWQPGYSETLWSCLFLFSFPSSQLQCYFS